VLAEAGGITDRAGNNPHIQVVDPATGSSRVLSLNDVAGSGEVAGSDAAAGEIVYVPKTLLSRHLCSGADQPLINVPRWPFTRGTMNLLRDRSASMEQLRPGDGVSGPPPLWAVLLR